MSGKKTVEGLILLVVAMGALGAFLAGVVLLFLYFRSSRAEDYDEPVVYGNLVQCPRCGYMNPIDTAACLNCRYQLPRPRTYPAPPSHSPDYMAYRPTLPPGYVPPSASPPAPAPRPVTSSPPVPAEATVSPPPKTLTPLPRPDPSPNRPPDMPHAWLEGISGAMLGQTAVLDKTDMLVGRSTACDVQVFDPKVSRRHFLIRFGNGAFFLQDQQSSRGTHVNGERIMAQRVDDGDRIDLGDTSMILHVEW
jgi:hypothetical protein